MAGESLGKNGRAVRCAQKEESMADNKKFQVALDLFTIEDAMRILEQVGEYVDIIEVGTPLMVAEGARAVRTIKDAYPTKTVFADIKVMDGGGEVPKSCIQAGCDMFSVLCASDDATLRAAIELAHANDVMVLADMCNVKNMEERAAQVAPMGPDYLCCHVGFDHQATGADPVEELKRLSGVSTPKAIAGGIKLSTFKAAVESEAQDIISGGAIFNAEKPGEVARQMREILDAYNASH